MHSCDFCFAYKRFQSQDNVIVVKAKCCEPKGEQWNNSIGYCCGQKLYSQNEIGVEAISNQRSAQNGSGWGFKKNLGSIGYNHFFVFSILW